jgi:predicted negative regulator of RcsB-dependent stress response
MSRYDTEQEQMEAIKAWWNKNGTLLLSGVLIVAIAFAGWRYWQSYQYGQAATASAMFEVLELSQERGQFGEVSREARKLMQDQPSSPYAGAAALMLAKFHWEKAEHQEAVDALNWILNADQTDEMKLAASMRLARLHIELQQFDHAQSSLEKLASLVHSQQQQANVDYIAATMAFAQKDFSKAYEGFKSVFDNPQAAQDLRNLARLQMDDLTPK